MPATCIFEVNKMGSKEFSFSGLKPQTNYTVIKEIYDKFCDPGRHKAIHYCSVRNNSLSKDIFRTKTLFVWAY